MRLTRIRETAGLTKKNYNNLRYQFVWGINVKYGVKENATFGIQELRS